MESPKNTEYKKWTDAELIELWHGFGDISINNDDEIEKEFLWYPVGTYRFDIWHWFDRNYSKGVRQLISDADGW